MKKNLFEWGVSEDYFAGLKKKFLKKALKSDTLWPKNNVFHVLAQSVFKQEVVQYERFVSSSVDKKKKFFLLLFFFDVVSFRLSFLTLEHFSLN